MTDSNASGNQANGGNNSLFLPSIKELASDAEPDERHEPASVTKELDSAPDDEEARKSSIDGDECTRNAGNGFSSTSTEDSDAATMLRVVPAPAPGTKAAKATGMRAALGIANPISNMSSAVPPSIISTVLYISF